MLIKQKNFKDRTDSPSENCVSCCPVCNGTGIIFTSDDEEEFTEPCPECSGAGEVEDYDGDDEPDPDFIHDSRDDF